MGCKEVDFTINDRKYKVMEWPPTYALKIKARILKQIGTQSLDKFSFEGLDPDRLVELMGIVTKDVMSYDTKRKLDFDEYFSDFPEDLYPMLIKVLNIQFNRFFGGNGSAMFQKVAESISRKLV